MTIVRDLPESEQLNIGGRKVYLYKKLSGNNYPDRLLIQPVDDHDLEVLSSEVLHIIELADDADFTLAAFKVNDWNKELSPWQAPPVFGSEGFGGGAPDTLSYILEDLVPELTAAEVCTGNAKILLGGYSLAGFFSMWAGFRTDRFTGIAAASPSVWFPGWMNMAENNHISADAVYLSLGDKEEKTRNPVMRMVGDNIRRQYEILNEETARNDCRLRDCILEWNQGNHFREPDLRTAKGFAWLLNRISL